MKNGFGGSSCVLSEVASSERRGAAAVPDLHALFIPNRQPPSRVGNKAAPRARPKEESEGLNNSPASLWLTFILSFISIGDHSRVFDCQPSSGRASAWSWAVTGFNCAVVDGRVGCGDGRSQAQRRQRDSALVVDGQSWAATSLAAEALKSIWLMKCLFQMRLPPFPNKVNWPPSPPNTRDNTKRGGGRSATEIFSGKARCIRRTNYAQCV